MAVQSFREILGAPRSTASPDNSALVIIDAQNEYAEGKLKVSNAPETRKAIAALLKKYREGEGKIVHIVHDTPQGTPVFTPGSKLAEEYDELKPLEGEKVIRKIHPSAFADTELHTYLRGIGGLKVVLTGYMVRGHITVKPQDQLPRLTIQGPCVRLDDSERCRSIRVRRPHRRGLCGRSGYPRRQRQRCHEDGHA